MGITAGRYWIAKLHGAGLLHIGPIMDQLAPEPNGQYRIMKLNADENPVRVGLSNREHSHDADFQRRNLIDRLIGTAEASDVNDYGW